MARTNIESIKARDEYRYDTLAGLGSTNTRIPYYTNLQKAVSNGVVSVQNSSTLGFSITVLKRCKIYLNLGGLTGNNVHGMTLNATGELSTNFDSVTQSRKIGAQYAGTADANAVGQIPLVGIFEVNDVIRPHANGANGASSPSRVVVTLVAEEL